MADPTLGQRIAEVLLSSSNSLGNSLLTYALALAAVGTVVMALLELAKAVLLLRRRFHRAQLARWLGADAALREELLAVATGGYASEGALFDQPTEKMMAQVQAGANMAMDFPDRYPRFYGFLTRQPDLRHREDAALWLGHVSGRQNAAAAGADPLAVTDADRDAAKARARLQNLAARQLDAFQTETEYRWARLNQVVSVLAGAVLICWILADAAASLQLSGAGLAFVSLLGGLTAPFAKDVVTALSSFRKG